MWAIIDYPIRAQLVVVLMDHEDISDHVILPLQHVALDCLAYQMFEKGANRPSVVITFLRSPSHIWNLSCALCRLMVVVFEAPSNAPVLTPVEDTAPAAVLPVVPVESPLAGESSTRCPK